MYSPILAYRFSSGSQFDHHYVMTVLLQACGKIPVSVSELDVDFLSIAGQKVGVNLSHCHTLNISFLVQFYGPRMGALYVRELEHKVVPLYPLIIGAGQERGYRSGFVFIPCYQNAFNFFLNSVLRIRLTWLAWVR